MDLYTLLEEPDGGWEHLDEEIDRMKAAHEKGLYHEDDFCAALADLYSLQRKGDQVTYYASKMSADAKCEWRSRALCARARMLAIEKDVPAAIDLYKEALALDPENQVVLEELPCFLEREGRYEEAVPVFLLALKEMDDFHDLLDGLGRSYAGLERFEDAIACFKKCLDLPQCKDSLYYYHYMIGRSYESLDDPYRAMAHYQYSLDANPGFAHSLNNMAALYQNEEDDAEVAISYLNKALESTANGQSKELMVTIYINLSRLSLLKKDYESHRHYKRKLFGELGFPEELSDELDEDEYDGDVLA